MVLVDSGIMLGQVCVCVCVCVLLSVLGQCSAVTMIGKCDPDRLSKMKPIRFNIDEFAMTNKGSWPFVSAQNIVVEMYKIKEMAVNLKPTSVKGKYDATVNYIDTNCDMGVLLNVTVKYCGCGLVKAEGEDFPYTLKFYFLAYKPKDYAYFYVCADEADTEEDYRYVLSVKGALNEKDAAYIKSLEDKYKFRGNISNLCV